MNTKNIYDIAVLGAGAAGLMAAVSARKNGADLRIAVLEKNEKAGKKLYATGSGRCNVLNRTAAPKDYRRGEGEAADFVREVFDQCGPQRLREIFAEMGIDMAEEGEGRLYPRSFQAASVVHALERGAFGGQKGLPAELVSGFEAKTVTRGADGLFCIAAADGRTVLAKRLILASGGKAGIQYGSDGRGLKIAESLGHRVVKPIPALSALVCEEAELLQKLAGVRAQGCVRLLKVPAEGGEPVLLAEDTGEIQFTKDTVSGICVMNVSGFYRRKGEERFVLQLDLMPEIEETILAEKLAARKAQLGDWFLDALLPEKLAAALADLPQGQTPEGLAHLLKSLCFTPAASKGWKEAHTTSGGIALEEIDPQTMESKIVPGLFAAGEALDVDGPCGGYSLTWAFAGGWIAGQAACR